MICLIYRLTLFGGWRIDSLKFLHTLQCRKAPDPKSEGFRTS